ncbi:MAG: hypothetical protein WB586_00955 [Chthoniobacterales bacterium]
MATTPTAYTPHLKVLRPEPEVETLPIAPARPKPEPEHRLWKITSEVVSPKHRYLEGVIFVFFGVIAVIGTFLCFSQLFRMLNDDFISQVVRILLQ